MRDEEWANAECVFCGATVRAVVRPLDRADGFAGTRFKPDTWKAVVVYETSSRRHECPNRPPEGMGPKYLALGDGRYKKMAPDKGTGREMRLVARWL